MMNPVCYEHRDKTEPVKLCPTCQRIAVEHDIVIRTVDAFIAAGYQIRESEDGAFGDSREATLAVLFDLDDAFLIVKTDAPGSSGWIRFVFGNDGYDVISDYTTNLEAMLAPINAYADTLAP